MRWYLRVCKLVSPSVCRTITDQHNKQTTLPFPQSNKGIRISILARQFYDTAWNKLKHRRKELERGCGNCSEAGIDVLKETCYSVARTKQGHAKVAQSVEHSTENAGVGGSIPPLGTANAAVRSRPRAPAVAVRSSPMAHEPDA